MYPSDQPQIVWGNQQYPSAAQTTPTLSDGKLWGSKVRRLMGIIQISCGAIAFAFGIAVICVLHPYYYDNIDNAGWGLWNGVFATVTGFLGVYSHRKRGMVIAYMVTSIICAVLSAACCIYAGVGASRSTWRNRNNYNVPANLAMYIILSIIFFIQTMVSIIGASFTCGAVCSTTKQPQQIIYYYAPPAQTQQYVPAPPYTLVGNQQFIPPQNTQSFQSTITNASVITEPSKM